MLVPVPLIHETAVVARRGGGDCLFVAVDNAAVEDGWKQTESCEIDLRCREAMMGVDTCGLRKRWEGESESAGAAMDIHRRLAVNIAQHMSPQQHGSVKLTVIFARASVHEIRDTRQSIRSADKRFGADVSCLFGRHLWISRHTSGASAHLHATRRNLQQQVHLHLQRYLDSLPSEVRLTPPTVT